jgi:hypothetical protein
MVRHSSLSEEDEEVSPERSNKKKVQYPSLLEEKEVSRDSFSARFAASNREMQSVGKRIQKSTDIKIAEIHQEWELRRKEVAELTKN